MRKNTIIEHDTFNEIIKYQPAVTGSAVRNHLKMELLNSIISAIGEKWNRMKKETKSAFEYICFLAIEKGFAYAGSEHVSQRHDIDSSTIRRHLSYLEKEGCITRLWRSSSKHNGRGQAVIFLNAHPYYKKYWQSMFFLNDNTQPNAQAEIIQTPCESKENDRKIESTINKPNILKDLNKRTKDWVDEEFTRFAGFFFPSQQINEFWKISYINAKKFNISSQDLTRLSIHSIQSLVSRMKAKTIKNPFGYYTGLIRRQMKREQVSNMFLSIFES